MLVGLLPLFLFLLPPFTSEIIVSGLRSYVNRKLLLASLCCEFVTECNHTAYNFPFRLSENYAQITLDNVNCSCTM